MRRTLLWIRWGISLLCEKDVYRMALGITFFVGGESVLFDQSSMFSDGDGIRVAAMWVVSQVICAFMMLIGLAVVGDSLPRAVGAIHDRVTDLLEARRASRVGR